MRLSACWRTFWVVACCLWLAACGTTPSIRDDVAVSQPRATDKGNAVALYALNLIDTAYAFGGKTVASGFDCSGMVSHIFRNAAGLRVDGSAADIARRGQPVPKRGLRAGDLVFFNTLNRAYSHVGVYVGEQRFVHAPSSNGKVRIDRLDNTYYAERYEGARTYFQ